MPSTFDIDNSTHAADPIFSSSTASSAQHSPLRIKLVDMVGRQRSRAAQSPLVPRSCKGDRSFPTATTRPSTVVVVSLEGVPAEPAERPHALRNSRVLTHITTLQKRPCSSVASLDCAASTRALVSSAPSKCCLAHVHELPLICLERLNDATRHFITSSRICTLHLREFGTTRLSYFRVLGS